MNGNGNAPETVAVAINGTTVQAEKGRLLIDVAEEMEVFIPRFCYHPGMKSVAVCRMCLVEVEGQNKLLPACATPVAADMNVNTVSEDAVDAQEGMLEFLLINHPLDCPICDRAGECPLQDQTYRHGPGSSRYVEPKRTFQKALEISELVVLDRERCVLCWRCVRFCDEISGDQFIQLVDRGPGTQILTFSDEPFDSYFSGNTIQICPVGALTSKPYRFVSRPWDLETAPSVCSYCSVGCPITNESRDHKVVRCQALPNEEVNDFWICDKGRFGYHFVSSDDRLMTPLVRGGEDTFEATGWSHALEVVAAKLKEAERIGVIAGGHLTTEDAYGIQRLARDVLQTPHLDSRVQDAGAPYELAIEVGGAAGSSATLDDLLDASSILWVGPDPKETLPVLYLRLRKAVIENGAKLTVVSPHRISLDAFANEVVRCEPGAEADAVAAARGALSDAGGSVVVAWGPAAPGRDETGIARAAVELAGATGGKLLVCPPHAGSQGLIDMGVHPSLKPGYEPVEAGKDTRAILEAAAAGELDALLIFGADLLSDFPDADLAQRALSSATFTVVTELFPTETVSHADVVLPSAAYAEREGTFTNLERRLQKLEKLTPLPGSAREPWNICAAIAKALDADWGWTNFDDVWTDIKKNVPTHKDVNVGSLRQEHVSPPRPEDQSGFVGESEQSVIAMAGPGGQYPKGFRQGAPFQTGQNWPLSWELRAFEAKQRPGFIPTVTAPPERSDSGDGPGASRATEPGPPKGARSEPHSEGGDPPQKSKPGGTRTGAAVAGTGQFALYTGRLIYDEGAMVSKSMALRNLQRRPFVEMNDQDVKELGLSDGDEVTVSANGFSATVTLAVGDIARGAVFVPYDQHGLRANRLIRELDPMVTLGKS